MTVAGGIATFANLADNTVETITLLFTSPGLAKATSNPINITDPPHGQVVGSLAKAKESSQAKNGHASRRASLAATTKPHAHVAVTQRQRPRQSSAVPADETSSLETVPTASRISALVRAASAPPRVPPKLKASLAAYLVALSHGGSDVS